MSRSTRSKHVLAPLEAKTDIKATTVSKEKASKVNNAKKRTIKKKVDQDENLLPLVKSSKTSSRKNAPLKTSVLGSKLHSTKKDNSSRRKNTELTIKSPALRDRTNTTSECVKDELSVKTSNEVLLNGKNNKLVQKQKNKKLTRKNTNNGDKLQVSLEKYCIKTNMVKQKDLQTNGSEEMEEISLGEKSTSKNTNKKDSKKASDSNAEKNANYNEEKKSLVSDTKSISQNSNVIKNGDLRRKNISDVDIEELLTEDDEIEKGDSSQIDIQSSKHNDDQLQRNDDENEKTEENKKITKKFFKNIVPGKEIESVPSKRNTRQRINTKKKKIHSNDSTFSPKVEESNKLSEKKLRPRSAKNYCEVSKLSQNSNSPENKATNEEEATIEKGDQKGIPIYKTIKLTEENVKDKKEIYDFPDDSQESQSRGKKRKKVAKRPTVKRPKKITTSKVVTQKNKKKSTKKVVQFEKQNEETINLQQTIVVNNIHADIIIPEHLENAGDSTIADASTIRIISHKQLEGSERINLTTTPPVPKTITSELKLFGPKNVITSKPTTVYSNMVNHSLIRQSMSPIKKLVNHFDAGSPWRANEAFSRVQQVVQSTPQINRLPLTREKKLPVPMMRLNEKSLSSEDTIHLSSYLDNKQSNNLEKPKGITLQKENEVSPRTFGTVISNLSPVESNDIRDSNNIKSSINQLSHPQVDQQSPLQTSPLQTILPQGSIKQNEIPNTNKVDDIGNTLSSPQKSSKKKSSIPSPFRFEKIRSSKRIAMQSPVSTSIKSLSQSSSQKENVDPDPEAGPSWVDKPKSTTVLRQSNLNNFLNLDEMPESTRISTAHGIFDDPHSTPINGRKVKQLTAEPNIENAFGFDDCDLDEISEVSKSTSMIATEKDVKMSVKGKLFPNARVKSAVPSRITESTVKKALLKNVLKNTTQNTAPAIPKEADGDIIEEEKDEMKKDAENNNESENTKKVVMDAISFSDTFDVLSENGEIDKVVPEEMPLFVDLEPAHFTKPPRRSYHKRKRDVRFDTSNEQFYSDEDEPEKPKQKKKKESKQHKQEEKRMREWVQNVNKTFDEIEHYDLIVE